MRRLPGKYLKVLLPEVLATLVGKDCNMRMSPVVDSPHS